MADNLIPSCVGRTVKVDTACGCTLTKATIKGFTPQDIIDLDYKEIYLTKAVLDAKEAKMLGVPENNLAMLINGTIKNIKEKLQVEKIDEQSIIMPYIQRTQREYVNANYWAIVSGAANPNAGIGSVPINAWDLTLTLGNSPWQTALEQIQRYFSPGATVIVKTWDSHLTKVARTLDFTVYASVNADSGANKRATVTVYPPVNATDWAGYTTQEKAVYRPTFGMAENGTNSTLDVESYCPVQPADLSRRIIVNWLQTSRESYCRESTYEEVLDLVMKGKVNDYLKGFKSMTIADQQKMQKIRYDNERLNSFFFGQAIDVEEQTPENYRNLPKVYDIINTDCHLAYKAKALGIFTLLSECNRVIDMQGARLNLNDIFDRLYTLKRNREAGGDDIETIDSITDRLTANYILDSMTKYYNARYGMTTVRYFDVGQTIKHENVVLFNYNIYQVPDAMVNWAVFVVKYFDDLVAAYAMNVVGWDFRTRANNLWFLDWSDIAKGVAGTSQADRQTPNSKTDLAAWQCVITPTTRSYDLRSETWTAMLDRPSRHLIYHNFASGCPIVAVSGCTVPQS